MAQINLGKIIPSYKGIWDSTVEYEKLDVVHWRGSSFVSTGKAGNKNQEPDPNCETDNTEDTDYWILLSHGATFKYMSEEDITDIARQLGTVRYIQGTGNYNEF